MTNLQTKVILTAIVDALVTIATLIATNAVKDPAWSAALPTIIASIQAVALAFIGALTVTEVATIRAASEERMYTAQLAQEARLNGLQ